MPRSIWRSPRRQKITLYERIAGVYDEEYLDHERAAEALQTILQLDPEHQGRESRVGASLPRARTLRSAGRALTSGMLRAEPSSAKIETGLQLGRVLSENLKQPDRALAAYERVLELSPEQRQRARPHWRLCEPWWATRKARFDAIDALSDKATTPQAKADLEVRAAQVLEGRGDSAGALRRYRLAPSCYRKI